jgi:hypothetical protein
LEQRRNRDDRYSLERAPGTRPPHKRRDRGHPVLEQAVDPGHIAVLDTRSDETLEFEVDGSAALDAFNHPYAYAATRKARKAVAYPSADRLTLGTERSPHIDARRHAE